MIEVLIAVFLTMIAIVSIMTMQPMSWNTASKSDYQGRAAGLLQTELEWQQERLMRDPSATALNSVIDAGVITRNVTVNDPFSFAGPQNIQGDATFNIATTVTTVVGTNSWLVNVRVTWPGNSTGITNSLLVTRQLAFRTRT